MITNIWMRLLLGGHAIGIGIVLLLCHYHRHRDNLWGQLFRLGREPERPEREESFDRWRANAYFYLGWMAVAAGLMILLIGFRPTMVG